MEGMGVGTGCWVRGTGYWGGRVLGMNQRDEGDGE